MPFPGTKRRSYLEENIAAAEIELIQRKVKARIDEAAPLGVTAGDRYTEHGHDRQLTRYRFRPHLNRPRPPPF